MLITTNSIAAGIIFLVILAQASGEGSGLYHFEKNNLQVQEGEMHYNLIVKDSQMPRYGKCWKNALQNLEMGCKRLTDEVQSRLALEFANCFLAKSGLETYPCDKMWDIRVCLEKISNNGFTAYTNFFTHTQSMCHFLQSQVWNEETQGTINRLSANSLKVQQQLENSSQKQEQILQSQLTSLEKQQELLDKSLNLRSALDNSKEAVRLMLQEFKISTDEQRHILFETFDRVAKLQNLVLGEMSGIYSFMFYPTALLVSYLLTSTSRTAAARFWIFTAFSCTFVIERLVTNWSLTAFPAAAVDEASNLLYGRIWLVRKTAMILCVGFLSYSAATFRDLNIINNALLEDIRRQNLELKVFLQSRGHLTSQFGSTSLLDDVTDSILVNPEDAESFSSDSDTSYDSQATDVTYTQKVDWQDSDSEIEESVRATSPYQRSTRDLDTSRNTKKSTQNITVSIPTVRRSPYNLRARKTATWTEELPVNESEESFTKTVKRMARISRRNADKVLQVLNQRKNESIFSSDED